MVVEKGLKDPMRKTRCGKNLQYSANGWTEMDSEDGQLTRDKK